MLERLVDELISRAQGPYIYRFPYPYPYPYPYLYPDLFAYPFELSTYEPLS
jgi:hypothetical protein